MCMQTDGLAARLRWCVWLSLVSLAFPMVALAQGGAQVPGQLPPGVIQQIQAMQAEKATWTPAQRKIDSKLLRATKRTLGQAMVAGLPALRQTIRVDRAGSVLVDIKATVTDALLARITALGGQVVNSFANFSAIRARVPLAQIQALAAEPAVRSIRPVRRAISNVPPQVAAAHSADQATTRGNTTITLGDVAHKADQARAAFGVDGTGVKIGVLSDGVDELAALMAAGELPMVTVLPGQSGAGATKGTAMLEIIHDLAPGAELFFATRGDNNPALFATNILALRDAGCHVIVDDGSLAEEPVFQDGPIAQAVETVVAGGVSYFSAAGDQGNRSSNLLSGVWEGDFAPFPDGSHGFGDGANFITITEEPQSLITLQWSDPIGGSRNDYDLFLFDPTGFLIDSSEDFQGGNEDPLEVIDSSSRLDRDNLLLVALIGVGSNRFLHLNVHGGRLNPRLSTNGQIFGHAAAAGGFGVAAVNVIRVGLPGTVFDGSESVELDSSDGPRRVFFEADGTPFTPGNFSSTGGRLLIKPDIAAADLVNTTTPGFPLFGGTSAAAPHAAAIAALMISKESTLTPAQIKQIMTGTAIDLLPAGPDRDSGFGIVDALAALEATCPQPSAVCQDLTRTLTNGAATVTVAEVDSASIAGGGCAITNLQIKKIADADFGPAVTFDCSELGPQDVTLRITQFGGQTNECTATITILETDADGDGVGDCSDGCPDDPAKVDPGACGCGNVEIDTDGDGVFDCVDNCLETPNPDQADADRDGVGDACRCDKPGTVKANIGDDLVLNVGESKTLGGGPTAVGGVPPYQYQWLIQGVDTVETFTSIHPLFTAKQPGTFLASLEVTDSSGCISSASLNIVVNGSGPAGFLTDGLCAEDLCGMGGVVMPLTLVGIGWLRWRRRAARSRRTISPGRRV